MDAICSGAGHGGGKRRGENFDLGVWVGRWMNRRDGERGKSYRLSGGGMGLGHIGCGGRVPEGY